MLSLLLENPTRRYFIKETAAVIGGTAMASLGLFNFATAYAQTAVASTTTAEELVKSIRQDLAEIDAQIRNHVYIQALQKGKVTEEALKAFPGHQYHTIISDLRSMATLVQRFGEHPLAGPFFNGILQGEFSGLSSLLVLAQRLGMTEADLQQYEVVPEGFTYATFLAWQSVYASVAEVTCGILVNFDAWGYNCGQMSKALQANYHFSTAETAFLDSFANLPSFEEEALSIIQTGLDQGTSPQKIRQSARLFQAYEKMFWDTLAKLANLKHIS